MKTDKRIEKKLEQLAEKIEPRAFFLDDVINRIENSPVQLSKKSNDSHLHRRFIMKKTLKLTAAAVILIATTLSLMLIDKTVPNVYALEQTIDALNTMRSIHAKVYYHINPEPAQLWAEFYPDGEVRRIRVSQPAFDTHDGPKEAVCEYNIAQVWSKKTNTLYYIRDIEGVQNVSKLFRDLDPKLLVQKLEQMQSMGKAKLDIEQPDDISEPIVINANLVEEDPYLGYQAIVLVDQATRLVISLETFKTADENGHFGMQDFLRIEFYDYNVPFEDNIFSLNVPDDVIVIDRAETKVGLSREDMDIKEIAAEVVDLFFRSLIEGDYKTAGLMYGGVPAEKIQESFGKQQVKFIKVVSTGDIKVHPNPMYKDKAFIVPCLLEFLENGQTRQKTYSLVVKEVEGQPGQWAICGGI